MIRLSRLYSRSLLSLVAVLLFQNIAVTQSLLPRPRLLAYYAFWDQFNNPPYTAAEIPYRKLTHICHAFLLLATTKMDGSLAVSAELSEPDLITRAHEAGVKVLISVGGGDETQGQAFSTIAAVPAYRDKLTQNLIQFVQQRGYDGLDIDWEVPTGDSEKRNCTLLMSGLRRGMPDKLISMATSATPGVWGDYDFASLALQVDFFNVMAYDFHGPWSSHAGHNSPLLLNPADPELEGSCKTPIDAYQALGVPTLKINMGTPFYGYEFDGVGDLWQYCPDRQCSTISTNTVFWPYIKQQLASPDWKKQFDPVAQAPYRTSEGTHAAFLTYGDAYSTYAKAIYGLEAREIGGVFMWEISEDYDGSSQELLDSLHLACRCSVWNSQVRHKIRVR